MERPVLSAMDPADAALDERALDSAFWADAWTDQAGVHWELRPTSDADGAEGRRQFAGRVLRDGSEVGNWAVEVDPQRRAVTLQGVELKDESAKGQGFGTARLARMSQRMQDAGVETIELKTGMSGFAVWPRMGFDAPGPPTGDWASPRGQAARHAIDVARSNATRLRLRPEPGTDRVALYHAQQKLDELSARESAPSLREVSEAGAGGVRGLFEGVGVRMSAAPDQVLTALELNQAHEVDASQGIAR